MTYPSPNPAGQHRKAMRTALAQWIASARIPNVGEVFRSEQPEALFEASRAGSSIYNCVLVVTLPEKRERRLAYTGPLDPGGKMITYDIDLLFRHRTYSPGGDWAEDADDFDRIENAVEDTLRGPGRDAGRPDMILTIAEETLDFFADPPVHDTDADVVDRWGLLKFEISQYLQSPGA